VHVIFRGVGHTTRPHTETVSGDGAVTTPDTDKSFPVDYRAGTRPYQDRDGLLTARLKHVRTSIALLATD
jgi:hypothetical protein